VIYIIYFIINHYIYNLVMLSGICSNAIKTVPNFWKIELLTPSGYVLVCSYNTFNYYNYQLQSGKLAFIANGQIFTDHMSADKYFI